MIWRYLDTLLRCVRKYCQQCCACGCILSMKRCIFWSVLFENILKTPCSFFWVTIQHSSLYSYTKTVFNSYSASLSNFHTCCSLWNHPSTDIVWCRFSTHRLLLLYNILYPLSHCFCHFFSTFVVSQVHFPADCSCIFIQQAFGRRARLEKSWLVSCSSATLHKNSEDPTEIPVSLLKHSTKHFADRNFNWRPNIPADICDECGLAMHIFTYTSRNVSTVSIGIGLIFGRLCSVSHRAMVISRIELSDGTFFLRFPV